MLVDVDHFKLVNDRFGHPAGDAVLRELAVRTVRQVRNVDLVGRVGGEEFVVVMPETSLADAMLVAERLRAAIADEPFILQVKGQGLPLTVSVGIAMTGEGGDTRETLLKRADEALYAAKHAGRNRVVTPPAQRAPAPQQPVPIAVTS
jgi:two-component system cell cycle response regulator